MLLLSCVVRVVWDGLLFLSVLRAPCAAFAYQGAVPTSSPETCIAHYEDICSIHGTWSKRHSASLFPLSANFLYRLSEVLYQTYFPQW